MPRRGAGCGRWTRSARGIGLPLNEIPPALSKGVIDGVSTTYEIAPSLKLEELVDHFTELEGPRPRLNGGVFAFLMNKNSYAKLPPDLKRVIDANSGRNIARMAGENWVAIEGPAKKVMQSKSKNQFHVLPLAEVAKMQEAVKPVYARWFEEMKQLGIDGPRLLADARALIDKHSK